MSVCTNCNQKLKFTAPIITLKDKTVIGEECYSTVLKGDFFQLSAWSKKHDLSDFKEIFEQGTELDLKEVNAKEKEQQKEIEHNAWNKVSDHGAAHFEPYYFDDVDHEIIQLKNFDHPYLSVPYSDVVAYNPIDRGHSEKKKHGLLRAATGGILLGPAGAVVGAVTGGKHFDFVDEVAVNISLKNGSGLAINFINRTTKRNKKVDAAYAKCNQLCAILEGILATNKEQRVVKVENIFQDNTSDDVTDQLRKLKSLVDDGILTQDEFDAKKRQILGI